MFSQAFVANRPTPPWWPSIVQTLQQQDATAIVLLDVTDSTRMSAQVSKSTDWTAAQITSTQSVIDTAPADTPEIEAQFQVDGWPIVTKALLLALLDQINLIRSKLPTPLAAITPAQAIQAVRDKAGAL